MELDRRQFVGAAGATALGVAGASVMGGTAGALAEEAASAPPKPAQVSYPGTNGDLSFMGEKPQVSDDDCVDTVTADIVIVGGGHAGIQCAKSAAEAGASVAVIERLYEDEDGEYYLRGQDVGHFNSQWLIDQGFGPYDTTEVEEEFAKRSGYCVNMDMIKSYVENSGAMFDAMVALVPEGSTILDPDQINVQQCYANEYPYVRGGYKTWAATAQFRGGILEDEISFGQNSRLPEFEMLAKHRAEDLGATWYCGYNALVLDQAEEGAEVKGVYATNPDGDYVKFVANKGVVLAAGDYGGDGVLAYHFSEAVRNMALLNGITEDMAADSCSSFFGNPGQGHKMGLWAGGYLDPYYRADMAGGGAGGPLGSTPVLYINALGKRFMNECQPISMQPQFRRTQMPVYSVWDANWEEFVKLCGVDHGSPDYGVPEYIEQCREDMAKVLDAGAEGYGVRSTCYTEREASQNICYAAETLEELADMMGLDDATKQTFLDTIAKYNEDCAAGRDTLFGRDAETMIPLENPPYYYFCTESVPQGNTGLTALAGLMTDEHMNVLSVTDRKTPIKGLYAAGNCLGGRYGLVYATPCSGNSVGMAMTNGYVLGTYLAENL